MSNSSYRSLLMQAGFNSFQAQNIATGSVVVIDAVADGVNDDTAETQSQLNAAMANGAACYLPAPRPGGSYRFTSPINITSGLRIFGDGWAPYVNGGPGNRGNGTWIQFDHTGKGFNIDGVSAFSGVFLENLGTFRNQPAPTGGWAPLSADFDIYGGNVDIHINNVMLLNPTKGIQINGSAGGRLTVQGLFGQPMQVGIDLELVEDTCRLNDIHFWPFWKNVSSINTYTLTNLSALTMERCDNPIISGFFSFSPLHGIVFGSNVSGITQRGQLSNIGIDTFGGNALYVLAGADGTSFTADGVYAYSGTNTTNAFKVSASNCLIQTDNVRASLLGFCGSVVNGTGNKVQHGKWVVDGYNGANNASPCFFTLAGNTTIICDPPVVTATNAAPVINSASTNSLNSVATGTWSIVNPATSTVISHNLNWTPNASQISLQYGTSLGGSTYYVDTITSTQFTIHGSPSGTTSGTWTIDSRAA